MHLYIFGAIVGLIVIWSIASYLVVWTIEEPAYTVIERKDGYEIRQYAPYIVAKTTVTGDYNQATSEGFRIIADYIFGNNTKSESISMTTPVLENEVQSEKISMTTPVLENTESSGKRTIAFVLPSKYTMDTLPTPNNHAVESRYARKTCRGSIIHLVPNSQSGRGQETSLARLSIA